MDKQSLLIWLFLGWIFGLLSGYTIGYDMGFSEGGMEASEKCPVISKEIDAHLGSLISVLEEAVKRGQTP